MPNRPPLASAPLAAIDMGSNSFRLEIARLKQGRYRREAYLKQTVRLGAGLDASGRLSAEAADRGLACLREFAARLNGFEPGQVRAVATQTLREARNRAAFLREAEAALGHSIEVIAGREEARLIYAGVSFLQPSNRPRLVIDIGGRSTEIIRGIGRHADVTESFQVGSVSLSMRWFPDGAFTAQRFRDAQVAAGAELEEALETFAAEHWQEALGSSGTAGAVSQMLAAAGVTDGTITPDGLRWCINACLKAGHVDHLDLPGLKPDRRSIVGGGLSLLYTLCTHFGIEQMQPARGALRQGVVIDLHERHAAMRHAGGQDARDHSVAELQQRWHVDQGHAARVGQLALAIFDALMPDADSEPRRELGWACDLHEIGMTVSHHNHHRHSAYLMANVDAGGFSEDQQHRIADLVLAQRGGLRKVEPQLQQRLFALQVLALRLAVIAHHARLPGTRHWPLPALDGHTVALTLDPDWDAQQPRTLHLLREEAELWSRSTLHQLVLLPN